MKYTVNSSKSIIDQIRKMVQSFPDQPAVVQEGIPDLSYSHLWAQAGKVAREIRNHGIGPNDVVAIELEKSQNYIISLLGVWRANAAFVPIPPSYPDIRKKFLVEDSDAKAIIFDSNELIHSSVEVPKLSLKEIFRCESAPFDVDSSINPADLAYIVYTSGSSGTPKGVAIEHKGLISLLTEQTRAFSINSQTRSLFLLSIAFDASLSDIGTCLISGATLCIPELSSINKSAISVAADLINVIDRLDITYVDLPPSLLPLIDSNSLPNCLETIVIGGEPCNPKVVRTFASKVQVVNVYGPTEATICTSLVQVDSKKWNRPHIGTPIFGVHYQVMSSKKESVSIGEVGELWIAGNCLARGYVNNDSLNREKFILHEDQRFYRTGDLVKVCGNNQYEFIGRIDRQIKFQGKRIEPEEIEATVCSHPVINRCGVISRSINSKRSIDSLVAFVETKRPVSEIDLKVFLEEKIPSWMMPSLFIFLNKIPETSSGKIDYSALKKYTIENTRVGVKGSETQFSETERKLFSVFQVVFGRVDLSIDSSFYELSGDSLSLLQLIIECRKVGIELTPEVINEYGTIKKIAAAIDDGQVIDELHDYSFAEYLRMDTRKWVQKLKNLDSNLSVSENNSPEKKTYFLTGATGFLGKRLVKNLLQLNNTAIKCLVRANSVSVAKKRLQNALDIKETEFLKLIEVGRISVVCGDIKLPRFGLSIREWDSLKFNIDEIVHCAADVNLVSSYRQLRSSNLDGTFHSLSLSKNDHGAPFHYISTLSVFVATDKNQGTLMEDDSLSSIRRVYGGYAQSKFASEVLVKECMEFLPIKSIFRLGLLTADRLSFEYPEKDLLTKVIESISQIKKIPKIGLNLQFDVTPVDYAAWAIIKLIAHSDTFDGCQTYHIANEKSTTFTEFANQICDQLNGIQEVSLSSFLKMLSKQSNLWNPLAIQVFWQLLKNNSNNPEVRRDQSIDLFLATGATFDCRTTKRNLAALGYSLKESVVPKTTNQYLKKMIAAISSKDYLYE